MRKLACALLVGSLVLAWAGVVQSGGAGDPRALVNKSIEAMGGEAKLAKYQSATFKEKGTYYGMGDGLPYEGNYAVQRPDKFRMEILGVFTMVLNGDKGWTKMGDAVTEMGKEQLAQQQSDHKASWVATLLPLKDKAYVLKSIDGIKVDGHETHGVLVTRKGYPDVKLYFDAKSNLLLKSEFPSKAAEEGNKDVTLQAYYQQYKDMNGTKMPTKMVMKRDGKLFVEATIVEIQPSDKLDPKLFAMP